MLLQWPKGSAGDSQALHCLPTSSSPRGSFHPCGGEGNSCTTTLYINDGRRNINSGVLEPMCIQAVLCSLSKQESRSSSGSSAKQLRCPSDADLQPKYECNKSASRVECALAVALLAKWLAASTLGHLTCCFSGDAAFLIHTP